MSSFYKNMRSTQIKVGIFITISLLILILSYGWLKDWFLGSKDETISILFDNANSIDKGSSVYYRGVRIGRVVNLTINNEGVLVDISVLKDAFITNDSVFIIRDKDMLGTKIVDITPGNSPIRINNNIVYNGTSMSGLSDLISRLIGLTISFEEIIVNMPLNNSFFAKIDDIFTATNNVISELEALVINVNNSEIFDIVSDIKEISSKLDTIIVDTTEQIGNTFTNLDTFLMKSDMFISALQDNLEKEDSNLNMLFNDKVLYENLLNSTKEIETLIKDIKENPRKYFKFSVF